VRWATRIAVFDRTRAIARCVDADLRRLQATLLQHCFRSTIQAHEVEVGSFADVIYTVSNSGQSEASSVVFSRLAGDWSIAGGHVRRVGLRRVELYDQGPLHTPQRWRISGCALARLRRWHWAGGHGLERSLRDGSSRSAYRPWLWLLLAGLTGTAIASLPRRGGGAQKDWRDGRDARAISARHAHRQRSWLAKPERTRRLTVRPRESSPGIFPPPRVSRPNTRGV
jgi:hypothetical protein